MPVQSLNGNVVQVQQRTTQDTANYASVNYQNTDIYTDITLKYSNSMIFIQTYIIFGVGNHDVAIAGNFTDSLTNSGTTVIAPHSTTGGDNNGSGGSRMAGYFGFGSFAAESNVDDWWVGNMFGQYLYTPASGSTSQRRISFAVRTSQGYNFRINMGQRNQADPRDVRLRSNMTLWEITR
tara:strand:- start:243 stop:782 length:540 start_codon:yes stop_codon:yes gene_type:complete